MRILLISVNRERMPAPVFPLGLAYIARALKEKGHQIEVLDLCFSQDPPQEIKKIILRFQPDLIGLSLRNLDNLTYPLSLSYLEELKEAISICRQFTRSKLVLGGSGFSIAPKELFLELDVDFGIIGEGEEILVKLVESLERRESLSSLPYLLIKGEPIPPKMEGARSSLSLIPERSFFKRERYLREGGMLNLQTKRGCPFSCIYCTYPLLEGREVRVRKIEEVIDEIRSLVQDGADYLYFVDDIFNYPPSYAEELCRKMVREQLKVRWNAFIHPGFLSRELLKWMKEAGCAGIEFGTDSGSSKMLQQYRKSFSQEEVIRASKLCEELQVNYCHYLLMGGPGEDEKTIEESFRLMDQLHPTAVIAMLGIRIYPGTELQQLALLEGVIQKDANLAYPFFYISPNLDGRLEEIIREKAMERRQWIIPGLEINISNPLMEQIRKFQIRGPLWELVGRMKKPRIKPLKSE